MAAVPVRTLFDSFIEVHYGFFTLRAKGPEHGDLIDARVGQANGLCGTRVPHQVWLMTGLHTGPVPVSVGWLAKEPPEAPSEWEDVVEASVEFPTTETSLMGFDWKGAVDVSLPQAGWHRARFSVCGMDRGQDVDTADGHEFVAPDRYLLQLWPAPDAPDRVIRQGSEIAAYWHRVAQGRDGGDGRDVGREEEGGGDEGGEGEGEEEEGAKAKEGATEESKEGKDGKQRGDVGD